MCSPNITGPCPSNPTNEVNLGNSASTDNVSPPRENADNNNNNSNFSNNGHSNNSNYNHSIAVVWDCGLGYIIQLVWYWDSSVELVIEWWVEKMVHVIEMT